MSYTRVIPRDLFNEANLLKCMAALWIALDSRGGHAARISNDDQSVDDGFAIEMDPSDGSISVTNVSFTIGGEDYRLWRPLNARSAWPLYVNHGDESIRVFTESGDLSEEFWALISGALVEQASKLRRVYCLDMTDDPLGTGEATYHTSLAGAKRRAERLSAEPLYWVADEDDSNAVVYGYKYGTTEEDQSAWSVWPLDVIDDD